jgi:hypothetical protein
MYAMSVFRKFTNPSGLMLFKCARSHKASVYPTSETAAESSTESDVASTSAGAESLTDVSVIDSPRGPVIVTKEHMPLWQRIELNQKYAFAEADIYLVFVYIELAVQGDVPDSAIKLLLDAVKLMRQCEFEVDDICSVLAHASAYFRSIYATCGNYMDDDEKGYILAALVYLAHTFVIDENCPLKYWHKRLFRRYSVLKVLDAAVMRMLKLLNYRLRVDETELNPLYERLQQAVYEGVISAP